MNDKKPTTPKDESPRPEAAAAPKPEAAAAPKDETPKDETPKDETPKDETPKDETPKDGTVRLYLTGKLKGKTMVLGRGTAQAVDGVIQCHAGATKLIKYLKKYYAVTSVAPAD